MLMWLMNIDFAGGSGGLWTVQTNDSSVWPIQNNASTTWTVQ